MKAHPGDLDPKLCHMDRELDSIFQNFLIPWGNPPISPAPTPSPPTPPHTHILRENIDRCIKVELSSWGRPLDGLNIDVILDFDQFLFARHPDHGGSEGAEHQPSPVSEGERGPEEGRDRRRHKACWDTDVRQNDPWSRRNQKTYTVWEERSGEFWCRQACWNKTSLATPEACVWFHALSCTRIVVP